MDLNIDDHLKRFEEYAGALTAKASGDASPMILKRRHTRMVLDNARYIVEAERPDPGLGRATILGALYHDIGRFEQYLAYKSFRDAETCNHGLLGLKIARKENMLAGEDKKIAGIALAAIGLHNRFALPAHLAPEIEFAANVVRDSDKLDILRVMDEHLSAPGPYNPTVVLSLPDSDDLFSQTVIDAALQGTVAAYGDLRSVNDFRLLLGTWFYEMHFAASKKRFVEDGYARRLVEALPQNAVYAKARTKLLRDLEAA